MQHARGCDVGKAQGVGRPPSNMPFRTSKPRCSRAGLGAWCDTHLHPGRRRLPLLQRQLHLQHLHTPGQGASGIRRQRHLQAPLLGRGRGAIHCSQGRGGVGAHRVREAGDLVGVDGQAGVAVPAPCRHVAVRLQLSRQVPPQRRPPSAAWPLQPDDAPRVPRGPHLPGCSWVRHPGSP